MSLDLFVTFSGFILAFYALAKPIVRLRIKTGFIPENYLFCIVSFIGFITIITFFESSLFTNKYISSICEFQLFHLFKNYCEKIIFHFPLNPLNKIICPILMIFIILYLYGKIIKPTILTQRNVKKYFEESSRIIDLGAKEDIDALIVETLSHVPKIFEFIRKDEKENYASKLIELFSSELFCKIIVKHHFIMLSTIFEKVKNNPYSDSAKKFITSLIFHLFTEPDSLLYKESEKTKQLIFNDFNFLNSKYKPLENQISLIDQPISKSVIDKYFEIIKFILKNYLNSTAQQNISPSIIENTLIQVSSIVRINSSFQIQSNNEQWAYVSGIISLTYWISQHSELFPADCGIQEDNYSAQDSKTIYDALAKGIFNIIYWLAKVCSKLEDLEIVRQIFFIRPNDTAGIPQPIKLRTIQLFKEHINLALPQSIPTPPLTVDRFLIRLLIYSLGLCEPNKASNPTHEFLLTKLKENFIGIYQQDQEFAYDMLPENVKYDKDTKKLILERKEYKIVEELLLEDKQESFNFNSQDVLETLTAEIEKTKV